jgi:hypothetical protein
MVASPVRVSGGLMALPRTRAANLGQRSIFVLESPLLVRATRALSTTNPPSSLVHGPGGSHRSRWLASHSRFEARDGKIRDVTGPPKCGCLLPVEGDRGETEGRRDRGSSTLQMGRTSLKSQRSSSEENGLMAPHRSSAPHQPRNSPSPRPIEC